VQSEGTLSRVFFSSAVCQAFCFSRHSPFFLFFTHDTHLPPNSKYLKQAHLILTTYTRKPPENLNQVRTTFMSLFNPKRTRSGGGGEREIFNLNKSIYSWNCHQIPTQYLESKVHIWLSHQHHHVQLYIFALKNTATWELTNIEKIPQNQSCSKIFSIFKEIHSCTTFCCCTHTQFKAA
jgi:hypothetical protein